jgi:hypothetical protein
VRLNGVLVAGVREDGAGVQVLGGAVDPAMQLRVTEFVYPFVALAVPLNVAVCPANTVSGELETDNL